MVIGMLWTDADRFIVIRNAFVILVLVQVGIAAVVIGHGHHIGGIAPYLYQTAASGNLIVQRDRWAAIALRAEQLNEHRAQVGIDLERLLPVLLGAVELSLLPIHFAAVEIRSKILGIETNRLTEILDGAIQFILLTIGRPSLPKKSRAIRPLVNGLVEVAYGQVVLLERDIGFGAFG